MTMIMWNKERIHNLLNTNEKAVGRALVAIFNLQTASEQACGTASESNNVGFSRYDAEFCSDLARQVMRGRSLSVKQLAVARNKMKRYHRQLVDIANSRVIAQPSMVSTEATHVIPVDPEQEEARMEEADFERIRSKFEYRMSADVGSFA